MEQDFVEQFLLLTQGARTPALFRLWGALFLLAASLERRVWIANGDGIVYPNLYVLLVAPPGTGKFIIEATKTLLAETVLPNSLTPAFKLAPDSMTNAALIDTLADSTRTFLPPKGGAPLKYNSLAVLQEEFSIMMPKYDMEYIGTLNGIFSNKAKHEERRRHGPHQKTLIEKPQLNILSGVQPSYLASLFPDEAWSTGLSRRLFMVYSSETPKFSLFHKSDVPHGLRQQLLDELSVLSVAYGEMAWEPAAMDKIDSWYMSGEKPVPEHSKLQYYCRTRGEFALKLSLLASLSRSRTDLTIRDVDVERALGWMLEAERVMPDIFRAMVGRSDKDVLEELHTYMFAKFGADRRPVRLEDIRRFLLTRVPHEKVESLIKAGESAGLWTYVAGNPELWVPKARIGVGLE